MRIVDIITRMVAVAHDAPTSDSYRTSTSREILIIEILADEGLTGLGFITGSGALHNPVRGQEIAIVKTVIERGLKDLYVGRDPFDRELLWTLAYRRTIRYGRQGAALVALGGIDIALWDLIGKATGRSVSKLLGGFRDSVPVYCSGGLMSQDDGALIDELAHYVERGFKLVKIKVGSPDIRDDIRRIDLITGRFGDKIRLLVDGNESWDVGQAMAFAREVADVNLYWLEEPLPLHDLIGYTRLASSTPIPIALGDYQAGKFAFRDFITRGLVNHLHADVTRIGGITEWIKLAHVAETWNVRCSAHAIQEVHIHTVGAIPNGSVIEYFDDEHQIQRAISRLFPAPKEVRGLTGGEARVPQGPGLGLEIDHEYALSNEIHL